MSLPTTSVADAAAWVRRRRRPVPIAAARFHRRVTPVRGHLLSSGMGAGRPAPPARRSAGRDRPARCGGRTVGSPGTAARRDSASHRMGIRRRSPDGATEREGVATLPVRWAAVVATPPGGRPPSTRAGGPAARSAGRRWGRRSLRHRYATGPAGHAGPSDVLLSPLGVAEDSGAKKATSLPSAPLARCARR